MFLHIPVFFSSEQQKTKRTEQPPIQQQRLCKAPEADTAELSSSHIFQVPPAVLPIQTEIVYYLVFQAIVLSSIAFILSYGLYLFGSQLFNQILGTSLSGSHFVSRLAPIHLCLAFIFSFLLAGVVAAIGAVRAVKIQPAESLRDV